MSNAIIRFEDVVKTYDDTVVLNELNLEIEQGKFYTLLGPSGCGKTTILRLISGFSAPSSGSIYFEGKKINKIPANKRKVNTVFQDYALFPHMNVFHNVAFGLKIKKYNKKTIEKKVKETLRMVQLSGFEERKISEMSGGQLQRVAIARALVNEPDILLLDEPLSALDLKLRTAMQSELRELQKRLGITFIFVTHDQEEALAMSDEIFVLNEGNIEQSGTPKDIYYEPINRFVAKFIGESNIVNGIMRKDNLVEFLGKSFECVDAGMKRNEPIEIMLRPEDLSIVPIDEANLVISVHTVLFRGIYYQIFGMDKENNRWTVYSPKSVKKDQEIGLYFKPEDIHVMRFNESEEDFTARLDRYDEE